MSSSENTVKGHYRLLDTIGTGGMGVVYRAEDMRTGHHVALKTLRVPEQVSVASLRREIEALAQLRHPGIVRIYEHGVDDEGAPWYAMELLEAVSLKRVLRRVHRKNRDQSDETQSDNELDETADTLVFDRSTPSGSTSAERPATSLKPGRGPLTPDEKKLLGYIVELCDALAYLHGEGLVHRDLKPENVLIEEGGRVVLLDFGLAIDPTSLPSTDDITVDHSLPGTAYYMAPEQLYGQMVDPRTDLYALGCILYLILVRRPPFTGEVSEILRGHIVSAPRRLRERRPALAEELDELVDSLLAKRREDRPGYAEDVARALLPWANAQPSRDSPDVRPYLHIPELVGQQDERKYLESRLEALLQGRGGLVLLQGEAGLGKTRLALDLVHEAYSHKVVVLAGRCDPVETGDQGAPLGPLRNVLAAMARRLDGSTDHTVPAESLRLLADFEPGFLHVPGVAELKARPLLSPSAATDRLARALNQAFADVCSMYPVMVVLDDMQWSDRLTLDWLRSLALHTAHHPLPLLVLVLSRPVATGQLDHLTEEAECLSLQPLPMEDLQELVGSMMASPSPPPKLISFLDEHAGGNPLFATEFSRAAVDAGQLFRDENGEWHLLGTESELRKLGLPTGLEDILARRLAQLDAATRGIAEILATIGRWIEMELLDQFASDAGTALLSLSRRRIIDINARGEVAFTSRAMREAVYRSVDDTRLRHVHRRVAEVLEEQRGTAEEIANHWLAAGVNHKARKALLAVATQARGRSDIRSEREALERWTWLARGKADVAETLRTEVKGRLAWAIHDLGETSEALEVAEEVVEEARNLGLPLVEARALFVQGSAKNTLGNIDAAISDLEVAEAIFSELNALSDLAHIHLKTAQILGFGGQYDRARKMAESAVRVARQIRDRKTEGQAVAVLGSLLNNVGQYEKARQLLDQSLAIHREVGDRFAEALAVTNLAHEYLSVGDYDTALELALEALDLHQEIGRRHTEAVTVDLLAFVHEHRGELDDALRCYQRAEALMDEVQSNTFKAYLQCTRAGFWRRVGDFEKGSVDLEAASFLETLDDPYAGMQLECERGYWALWQHRSAEDHLARARELGQKIGAQPNRWPGSYLAGLEAAQKRFLAGEPLLQGEAPAFISSGLLGALEDLHGSISSD